MIKHLFILGVAVLLCTFIGAMESVVDHDFAEGLAQTYEYTFDRAMERINFRSFQRALHEIKAFNQVPFLVKIMPNAISKRGECKEGTFVELFIKAGVLDYATQSEKERFLSLAVFHGNVRTVDVLIKSGVPVTQFSVAIFLGDTALLKDLIEAGARCTSVDEHGWAPLHYAAWWGRPECLQLLLGYHSQVDLLTPDNETPLLKAVKQNFDADEKEKTACIELLVRAGANANESNATGWSYLHCAADERLLSSVKQLIECGATVDVYAQGRGTPLHVAARNGVTYVVDYLIAQGASLTAQITQVNKKKLRDLRAENGATPLHCAAESGDSKCVELLLAAKADVHSVDESGDTPLHGAVYHNGKRAISDLLCNAGADLNHQNHSGDTPLHYAVQAIFRPCQIFLIERKAQINVRNQHGRTPLYCAAKFGCAEAVARLIAAKADVEILDTYLMTPLAYAILGLSHHRFEMDTFRQLIDVGIPLDSPDGQGYTPIHRAALVGSNRAVKYLSQEVVRLPHQEEVRAARRRISELFVILRLFHIHRDPLHKENNSLACRFLHASILLLDKDVRNDVVIIFLDELRRGKRDFSVYPVLQIIYGQVADYLVERLVNDYQKIEADQEVDARIKKICCSQSVTDNYVDIFRTEIKKRYDSLIGIGK